MSWFKRGKDKHKDNHKDEHTPPVPFQMPRGARVTDLDGVAEGFEFYRLTPEYTELRVNVSAERIIPVFCALGEHVREPGSLILERTAPLDEQRRLSPDGSRLFVEVHYLDNIAWRQVHKVFQHYRELLTHDGDLCFGYASHQEIDQVMVGSYKVFSVVTTTPAKYLPIFEAVGIPERAPLKTAWDTISESTPGRREVVSDIEPGMDDLFERLQGFGLYLAKHRPD